MPRKEQEAQTKEVMGYPNKLKAEGFIDYPHGNRKLLKFEDETKDTLIERGYRIYDLTRKSIRLWRSEGKVFLTDWHEDYPDIENRRSSSTQVAIKPDHFLFLDTFGLTFEQQISKIDDFSDMLSDEIPGAKAIMGEFPDYLELAFLHLKRTGEYLLGNDYTRTRSQKGRKLIHVGQHSASGIYIKHWFPDDTFEQVGAAHLIVPKRTIEKAA